MSRRLAKIALVLVVVVAGAGCSTPKTAPGSLVQGKERVAQLVLDAAHALPATARYEPPTAVGTQRCRKTIVGYAFGTTGAHRVELPLLVYPRKDSSASALLERLAAIWSASNYRLDRSRTHESRFPQLRAHATGGYDVVATALASPFVVKVIGERYPDYAERARVADVTPIDRRAWHATRIGASLPKIPVTSQIDLYAVSPCLRGS